jgi:heat shock protein HtpX
VRRAGTIRTDARLVAVGVAVLLIDAVLVVAVLGVLVWLCINAHNGWALVFFFVCFAVIGGKSSGDNVSRPRASDADNALVGGLMRRLCMVAECAEPEVQVVVDAVPLSWTEAVPGHPARIYMTTGLVELLTDRELAAVLGHELTHVVQRDAWVMTVAAAPGTWVLRGVRGMYKEERGLRARLGLLMFASYSVPLALLPALCSRVLSRYRELAADRGAAVITGSPAALASALARISDELQLIPRADLRLMTPQDEFHVLPARRYEPRRLGRIWATHPPLRKRLEQLGRMEAALQRPELTARL